ncbi:kelch-like protein 8 [Echinops telfairi]|uniref:Kelch-like protein 8 n=1 Tax=Echinops telfairi TaxID=9371 RepID=A0AC55CLL6_ECHTE|nr:kelch-like protein 8 [Echinops telfairi]
MASEPTSAKQAKNYFTKGKRQQHQPVRNRSSVSDADGDDSFVFEANEAWKDFHGSLLQFYENGELCDVTLKVGTKLISCHKLALACVIPYFRAMFLSEMAEARQTLIEIRDFDGDAIEDLVKFVYSSRLTLTVDNVQPLLYAACILQVELVARACCEYMKLHFHPSNCLAVRAFAESHNRIDLMDMADQYACEHFTEVVECEDFVSVSPQHLHKLLSSSDLNIENEKLVYSAAIKWLLATPQHHSKWLDETLAQVRLPLLPIDFLMGVVAKEQIVKQNLKCRDLLDEARNYHLHLSSRAIPDFEYSIRTTPRKHTAVFCCLHRRGIALASLGGPIYAIGGLDDNTCFNDVERYDIESDQWGTVAPMNTPRGGVGSVALVNHVYAVGGNDGVASLSSVEKYDPHLDKWIEVKEMGQRRAGNGVSELHGCLYVVGGFDDNSPLSSVERYDPRSNRWDYVAALTTPRGGVGIATVMGKIFAVGGHNGNTYLNTVEAFDPVLNRWELVGSVSHCRAGAGVTVCDCLTSQIRDVGHGSSNVVDCM